MNKKHGVGCTTLTYNLGRLFDIPIYVNKDSFMLKKENKNYFPNVSKITSTKKDGIMDIGAGFEKAVMKKFVNKAKVIVIPFDFGYETILETIDTLQFIREQEEDKIYNGDNKNPKIIEIKKKYDFKIAELNENFNLEEKKELIDLEDKHNEYIKLEKKHILSLERNIRSIKQDKIQAKIKCSDIKKEITQIQNEIYERTNNYEKIRTQITNSFKEQQKTLYADRLNEIESVLNDEEVDGLRIPIVLILNRLDKQDGGRDFNYKEYIKNKLTDAGFRLDGHITLTYLRNSYGLYSNFEFGEYFMDKLMSDELKYNISQKEKNLHSGECILFDENHFFDKSIPYHYNVSIAYRYFLDMANEAFEPVDYEDEEVYIQNKDMVRFRNHFKRDYRRWLTNKSYKEDYYNNTYTGSTKGKEIKLIKDMAFISFSIFRNLGFDLEERVRNNVFHIV